MKTLTIFTPAYNRAHTLERTYKSLYNQSCDDFEWLIVDDGSTDGTRELVESWIQENRIKYDIFIKKIRECMVPIILHIITYQQS